MMSFFGQQRPEHRHRVFGEQVAAEFSRMASARALGGPACAGSSATRRDLMTASARAALLPNRRRTLGTVVPAAAATDSSDIRA
jgi:hypothetical protein